MPPEQNQNQQVPPVTPSVSPANTPNPIGSQLDSLTKNPKFMETVKVFAIYGTILSVARWVINVLSVSFLTSYGGFSLAAFISMIFYAVISSAVAGVLFYFFFNYVRDFIKGSAFLSKYINNLFTFFWIPTLVGTVLTAVLAVLPMLAVIFAGGFIFVNMIVSLVISLALYYFFAKTVSAKLQAHYPW